MNRHILSITLCYLIWGLSPAFWKLLSGADSFYVLGIRILFTMLVSGMIGLMLGRGRLAKNLFGDRRSALKLLASAALIGVNWCGYLWGLSKGMALDCSLAYFINPILNILFGFLIFGEKLTKLQWLSVAIAAAGVIYPMLSSGELPWLALILALAFSCYGIIKKTVTVPGDVSTFAETLFLSPLALGIIIFMEVGGTGAISTGALSGWKLLLLPAAGAFTWTPLALFSYGMQGSTMKLSGILMYINPIMQMLLGLMLYDDPLTPNKLVTFVCVWIALILFLISQRRASAAEKEKVEMLCK